jgi:cysteine-rich repeat protein
MKTTNLLLGSALLVGACVGDSGLETMPNECGNGIIELEEQCDDGNDVDGDGCLATCQTAKCGDGVIYEDVEQCDDGNGRGGDGCSPDCIGGAGSLCGNGNLDDGEACDDGNVANNDACTDTCIASTCGDGYAQVGSEQCDDGNDVDDDGCRNDCTLAGGNPGTCPGIELGVSTTGNVSIVGQTEAAGDDYSFSCGGAGAPDTVYTVVPKTDGWLLITASGLDATDPLLAVKTGTCDGGQEVACSDSSAENGAELATLQVIAGEKYYVFVDGGGNEPTAYTLTLHLQTEVPGDSCPGVPLSITPGQEVTLEGNTNDATSDYKGEGLCSASVSTKELVYGITPTQDGTLSLQLQPGFDGVLYARVGSCTAGMQVGCADVGSNGGAETITLNAVANTKYSVFVDGYSGSAGNFTLTVALEP